MAAFFYSKTRFVIKKVFTFNCLNVTKKEVKISRKNNAGVFI